MNRMREAGLVAALALLAGCDDKPNADFQQAMKDRDAARAGDPYASLDASPSRPDRYVRLDTDKREAYVQGEAGAVRATYQAMLKTLDRDKAVAKDSALFSACRPLFDQVVAFQKNAGLGAAQAGEAGRRLAGELDRCRARAIAADADPKAKAGAALARRFASVGLSLTGIATLAHGDVQDGLQLWQEGDKKVSADKPGFRLKPTDFRAG